MASATTTLTLCQYQLQRLWSFSTSSLRLSSRVTCRASESQPQLSVSTTVDKTICQIKNSGVIACLRAN
ncbi:KHG/KDPG aldolase, partial [Trifolium pratense]